MNKLSPSQFTLNLPFVLVGLVMVLPGIFGCSKKPDREPVYRVQGRIVSGNTPAVNAFVIFHPVPDSEPFARSAHGRVDEEGEFQLSTFEAYDGAHAGDYIATVIWPVLTEDGEDGADQLKGRYAKPDSSPFKVTIEPKENIIAPFDVGR